MIAITNRRINALEQVVIPRFLKTTKYIETEMDEKERENIFT